MSSPRHGARIYIDVECAKPLVPPSIHEAEKPKRNLSSDTEFHTVVDHVAVRNILDLREALAVSADFVFANTKTDMILVSPRTNIIPYLPAAR